MSWNFNLRLNNLQNEVNQIVVGTVTNPLTSALNCNSLAINNATAITATTGQNLSLNTSGANSITINGPVNIPNHPLTITNNTTGDSMVVSDTTGDTSVFRIDASGNVGVKVNTSTTLTNDFTVVGNTLVTGNETVTGNITCSQLNYTTLNPPVSSGSGGTLTFIPVVGSPFTGVGPYTGSSAFTIGNFTIPANAVPNSTVLLYWLSWSTSWGPTPVNSLYDFRLGFGSTPSTPVNTWFPTGTGFIVQVGNTTNVPNPIPALPHTQTSLTPGTSGYDYTQLPNYVILNNVNPGQVIYVNIECPYPGQRLSNVTINAPYMIYQKV